MKLKRPRIGIPMRYEPASERFYLSRDYGEAVAAAGGLPLYLPLIPRGDYVEDVFAELDGLLLTGSASDVDPALFGEDPHPRLGEVHPLRDETDLRLLALAERARTPILAICYGLQILNVARGGTLIQDLVSQVSGAIKHEQGAPRTRRSHQLRLAPGNWLANHVGNEALYVNSHHHQGVGKLGRDLTAIAWAGDGTIEAVEDARADRFVIGVQWHPELDWENDAVSGQLFRGLIEAAKNKIFASDKAEAIVIN